MTEFFVGAYRSEQHFTPTHTFGPLPDYDGALHTHLVVRKLGWDARVLVDVGPGYSPSWVSEVDGPRLIPLDLSRGDYTPGVRFNSEAVVKVDIPALDMGDE